MKYNNKIIKKINNNNKIKTKICNIYSNICKIIMRLKIIFKIKIKN